MKRLFDIGANRGLYSDANQDKYDEIILIEANPSLCEFLKEKYVSNPKFKIVNVIVSDKEDTPFFICSNADTISTADQEWIEKSRFSKDYRWQKIQGIESKSVDQLIKEFGSPFFIKVDVEGYEYNVLRSLSWNVSPLCFEWAEEKKEEILLSLDYLQGIGYTQYALQMEDNYNYLVNSNDWTSYEKIYEIMQSMCDTVRKNKWGMIWVT
jgi:FkbM family methyltransferase